MYPVRHRLDEFSKINQHPKQTVRSIIASDEAPFSSEPPEGKQLTYGASEYLAWVFYTQLRNMGLPARFAAQAVRNNRIVDQVFKAEDRGDDLTQLFLIVERQEKRDLDSDVRSIWSASLQDMAAVVEILSQGAVSNGTENLRGETRLGLSGATIVPVLPCLERCESALNEAGFVIRGGALYAKE